MSAPKHYEPAISVEVVRPPEAVGRALATRLIALPIDAWIVMLLVPIGLDIDTVGYLQSLGLVLLAQTLFGGSSYLAWTRQRKEHRR